MNMSWKVAIGAAFVAAGWSAQASAMPIAPVQNSIVQPQIEAARLVCPPYRPCFRVYGGPYRGYRYGYGRPRPYGYGHYGYGRPYGYYRPYGFY